MASRISLRQTNYQWQCEIVQKINNVKDFNGKHTHKTVKQQCQVHCSTGEQRDWADEKKLVVVNCSRWLSYDELRPFCSACGVFRPSIAIEPILSRTSWWSGGSRSFNSCAARRHRRLMLLCDTQTQVWLSHALEMSVTDMQQNAQLLLMNHTT